MKPTFIDTSFLIALLIESDAMHETAVARQKTVTSAKLTTEFVLIELLDALTSEKIRPLAIKVVDLLRKDSNIEIIAVSSALLNQGLELLRARSDKQWGLTDCISFVVMEEAGAIDALTADHHFEQAGFNALLRHDPK